MLTDPMMDIRLVGLLTREEVFNGATSYRAIPSGTARSDLKLPEPTPKGDPDFFARRYCQRLHREINESRVARGQEPLPGDGWSEYENVE